MVRLTRRFCLAVGLSLSLSAVTPGQAETVKLSPDQLKAAAIQDLRFGQPQRALAYSDALLHRDKTDVMSHLIRARALRDLQHYGEARTAAKTAWALSDSAAERYSSSRTMAQILSSQGHRTRAQWWLRRAVEHAPDERTARQAIGDFRYVKARNPWLARISFSITPDSNINNGSSERSSFLNYRLSEIIVGQPVDYQLPGTARALSGIEYSLGLTTRYRFAESRTQAHDIIFTADVRHYTLSSNAKALAPDAEGNDFAFASYTLGYGHKRINLDRRGELRAVFDIGQSWYGGDEYARFARLSLGQSYKLHSGNRVNLRISGEKQDGITRSDSDTVRTDFSYTHRLQNGALLWTNVTGAFATSPLALDEFHELGLRAQLTLPKKVAGATMHLGLWARKRSYDFSPHHRDGRREDRVQADLTMVFNKVDYYGFNPTMRVTASKTDSNISLYDAKRFGVNFGIQSAF
jgi:Surface lipoprotein assembly modifier